MVDLQNVEIKVLYHDPDMPKLEITEKGNFIDLRVDRKYELQKGQFKFLNLGISIELPEGYWAQIVPRSSLFAKHGIIQANSVGVIDSSYCGDTDVWKFPALCFEDTVIEKYERICQFRIVKDTIHEGVVIREVDSLDTKSRGGFGSTGDI